MEGMWVDILNFHFLIIFIRRCIQLNVYVCLSIYQSYQLVIYISIYGFYLFSHLFSWILFQVREHDALRVRSTTCYISIYPPYHYIQVNKPYQVVNCITLINQKCQTFHKQFHDLHHPVNHHHVRSFLFHRLLTLLAYQIHGIYLHHPISSICYIPSSLFYHLLHKGQTLTSVTAYLFVLIALFLAMNWPWMF